MECLAKAANISTKTLQFLIDVIDDTHSRKTANIIADNLKLYSSIVSDLDVSSIQASLDRLQQWCATWQLDVNVTKCYVLHLGKVNPAHIYFFAGVAIPVANTVVDLGITVDPLLNFDAHINCKISKARSRVGALFKGFCTRSLPFLKKAFITYIRPMLGYVSSVWNPYLLKHIDGIERVQRQFTKRIHSLGNLTYAERLAAIDLEPLELRGLKADLVLYYKVLNNLVHIPRDYLPNEPPAQTIATRSGGVRLSVPHVTTNSNDNNFFSRCVACWNTLPDTVVNFQSVASFKRNVSNVDLRYFLHGNSFSF